MPAVAHLTERIVAAASRLGAIDISARVGDDVLVEHPPPDEDGGSPPIWNTWCAVKPPVACAALALLERAGVTPSQPLDEVLAVGSTLPDPTLTVAALLRHETSLPALDPVEGLLLGPSARQARLAACLDADVRLPQPVAAFSQLLGWWVLLATVAAACAEEPERLVQEELDAAGHAGIVVHVPPEAHADVEARLALHRAGDDRRERALPHDRARAVVVHGSAAIRGFTSPPALRAWYADLGRTLDGRRGERRDGFPSRSLLVELLAAPRTADDRTLGRTCSFAAGFMLGLHQHHFGSALSPSALGHAGWRGLSVGFLDPALGLAASFVHHRTGPAEVVAAVRTDVVDLLAAAA